MIGVITATHAPHVATKARSRAMLVEVRLTHLLIVAMKWLIGATSGRMIAIVSTTIRRDAVLVDRTISLVAHVVAPLSSTS